MSCIAGTMAESSPTYVSQLVKHMKYLTPEMDEDTLFDLALGNQADSTAEKLALKQGNTCSVSI